MPNEPYHDMVARLDEVADRFQSVGIPGLADLLELAHHRGRGRGSGLEIEARYYEVYTLTRGKIIRVDEYSERAHALKAAGLRE